MQTRSQHTNDSSCFSGLLRMIICRNGASTKPSDDPPKLKPKSDSLFDSFPSIKDQNKLDRTKVVTESDKPGIVARLMGLESLPDSKLTPKFMVKSPDSVFRSRSVNFMDYLLEVDLKADQGHQIRHRRVKTSVSFREVPRVLHPQQQDMLVLYLDNAAKEDTKTIQKPKKKKKQDGSRRKEKRVVNLIDDEPGRVHLGSEYCSSGSDHFAKQGENKIKKKQVMVMEEKEIMSELKFTAKKMKMKMKKKKKGKKIKSMHIQVSETSSPISVLDIDYKGLRSQKGSVQACKKGGMISNARKKKNDAVEMECSNSKRPSSIVDHESGIEYCLKMVSKVCNLLEKDIKASSNRVTVKEDFEEICLKMERAIMDHMVQEAVDELNYLC